MTPQTTFRWTLLGVGTLLALGLAGLVGLPGCSRGPTPPSYQGRDINAWLADIASSTPSVRTQAEAAFRAMGTNAVPTLVALMGTREDTRVSFYVKGWAKLLGLRKTVTLEAERHWRAAKALRAIGPSATAAIPSLTELLGQPQTRDKAVFALAGLGPEAVGSLTRALSNQDAAVRLTAASVMGRFGSDARSAVPALVHCLADTSAPVRQQAAQSLGQLADQADLVIPALTAALSDSDPGVRMSTALALAAFKGKAESAVTPLLKAKQDPVEDVRQAAMNALSQIRPGAADPSTQ
jgi:HEAT repeat protein